MKRLYNIFESLILENVSPDVISKTIDAKKMAKITYNGDDNNSKGPRTIVPFLYGVHNSGDNMIRAWQLGGDTDTKNYKWKTFKVANIQSWEVSNGNAKSVLTSLFKDPNIPDYVGSADADFDTVYTYIPVSDYMSKLEDRPNQFEPNVDKADGTTTDIETQREPIEVSNDDVSAERNEPETPETDDIELSPELEDEFLPDEEINDDDESEEDSQEEEI